MRLMEQKLRELKAMLSGKQNVLIFTHDHPDPDCIASGLLLGEIARYFGVKSKIVYGGNISRSENKVMKELLSIEMLPYEEGEERDYDLTAIVDTQKNMGNNSFPKSMTPDLTFDHHESKLEDVRFYDIDWKWGATASILLRYYTALYPTPSETVATAYCYALIAETKDLGPDALEVELQMYKNMYMHCNPRHISNIRHAKKPASFINLLHNALSNYSIKNRIFHCHLGEVDRAECLAEVADLFISIEDLDFVLIVASYGGKGLASARTAIANINLGNIMQRTFTGRGKAGGHEMVGAGQFHGSADELVRAFIKEVEPYLSKMKTV